MSVSGLMLKGDLNQLNRLITASMMIFVSAELLGAEKVERLLPAINPFLTVEEFPPIAARHIRFTILETSGFPVCLDEVEVFTAEQETRNVALVSSGAMHLDSGIESRPFRYTLDRIGDGLYGTSANRLHLHAQRLSFSHPVTKAQLTFEVKEDF